MTLSNLEKKIDHLTSVHEIERLEKLYCRALDRLDIDLLKSLFFPDAVESHGSFEGNAMEFAEHAMAFQQANFLRTFHTILQTIVDINGDAAAGESTFLSHLLVPGGRDALAIFYGKDFADRAQARGVADSAHDYLSGGRYITRYERRDGIWKIAKRQLTSEWNECGPTSQNYVGGTTEALYLRSKRDNSDPVYDNLRDVMGDTYAR